ncbi:MAG: LuxR C-terminal-related transcriptional regulator [Alicyclobacillaceae bacterium]|nr:LuxR C-terminal-related transcriptional regulator [Alicyclobacillaceae bacterium]
MANTESEAALLLEYKEALRDARLRHRKAKERGAPAQELKTLRGMIKSLEWEVALLERSGFAPSGATLVEPSFFDGYRSEHSGDPFDLLFGAETERDILEVPPTYVHQAAREVLTKNEHILLCASLSGMAIRDIAEQLDISPSSVRSYLRRIEKKLKVVPPVQTVFAWDEGDPSPRPASK